MTPAQQKAKELVDKYLPFVDENDSVQCFDEEIAKQAAKQCATIAVDEIIVQIYPFDESDAAVDYFEQVKQEIQKLP